MQLNRFYFINSKPNLQHQGVDEFHPSQDIKRGFTILPANLQTRFRHLTKEECLQRIKEFAKNLNFGIVF
ncbi:MAG: hypothetical protein LW809_02815 [Vampirovibrionales bacterium]|jgi:hypothetical protein|nr:hypothetical protein [Vampirovibrionales bacterium]